MMGDINVKNQVKVKFSVRNYVDNVLCDVVPMEACYVLLGRPWQFDKQTIHYGLTNEITFTHNNKKFVLQPLTPTQVLEDQVQMKNKLYNERKSETPYENIFFMKLFLFSVSQTNVISTNVNIDLL